MKIATVVVTYNRYNLLKECLDSLLNQTIETDIILIDNASTDGTSLLLEKDHYLAQSRIKYVCLDENIGGAGGFYEGMRLADDTEYDFVWLMDDDAEPEINCLELLLQSVILHPNYAAYACSVYIGDKSRNQLSQYGHRGMVNYKHPFPAFQKPLDSECYEMHGCEIEMASFVGILIPRDSINKVGLPRKEFFIHHDDTEYSLRLLSIGKLWMDNQSKIYHKELRQEEKCKKCFFYICKNRVKFEKLWLKYFGLRNSVYIALKYSSNKFVFLDILKIYFTLIKDIILFDDHKWVRIKFATSSVLDGVFGIFDNKKPKRILNEFTKL